MRPCGRTRSDYSFHLYRPIPCQWLCGVIPAPYPKWWQSVGQQQCPVAFIPVIFEFQHVVVGGML